MTQLSVQAEQDHPGRRIRALRTDRAWSQMELARRSRLGLQAVNEIELGKVTPRPESLRKIARALGVPLGDIQPKGAA